MVKHRKKSFRNKIIEMMNKMNNFFTLHYIPFSFCMILIDFLLSLYIINHISYTEIDWNAYMSEVKGFLYGDWNYYHLKGTTGPLVYPSGFVYIFSVVYYVCDYGKNVYFGQMIFLMLYIAMEIIVFWIYYKVKNDDDDDDDDEKGKGKGKKKKGKKMKVPVVFVIGLLIISKRIHSIFVLRCFNDSFGMFFLYFSIFCMIYDEWNYAMIYFSLGISVKMNVVLFLPGLLVLLVKKYNFFGMMKKMFIVIFVQVILAIPFLLENPYAYLNKSFELGRKFFYIWSVNFKFLPEDLFLDDRLHKALLLCHLGILLLFALKWTKHDNIFKLFIGKDMWKRKFIKAEHIVSVLFVSNFVGMVFARSIHYQFYVWYFHTLPFLLWTTNYYVLIKLVFFFAIEFAFNVYPANLYSSLLLTMVHFLILFGLAFSKDHPPYESVKKKEKPWNW